MIDLGEPLGLFLLALAVGVYGSIIGAGGGFLVVSGLIVFFDMKGAVAVGTSSVTTFAIQSVGAYTYDRKGVVDRPTASWFVLASMPAALFSAAFLASRIPQRAFEMLVGVLLLTLAAFVILIPSPASTTGADLVPRRPQLLGAGAAMGTLSGALGVGSGLIIVPLLSWVQKLSTHRAAATTSLIGAFSGAAAVAGHTIAGNPVWAATPFLVAGAVIGGRTGATMAGRLSRRTVLLLLSSGLTGAGLPLVYRSLV